jgi:uncharacterized repeat protein (TIGR01451 family)
MVGLAVFSGAHSALAGPPAGTPIPNFATGSGVVSGLPVQVRSDTVIAIVQALEQLTLAPPRSATAPPGTPVGFAHQLVNTGNVASDVRLDVANLAGDSFDLASFTLTLDTDGDGIADPGEPSVAIGGSVTLAPGASRDLVLGASIPGAAPSAALARVQLLATGSVQGASAAVIDTAHTTVAATPPALAFHTDGTFTTATTRGRAGDPLFVQAMAPGCDRDALVADTLSLTLASARTGDAEVVIAVETGAATGQFRITLPTANATGANPGDGTLQVLTNDRVSASLAGCGASLTQAFLWLDVSGIVSDSHTDLPIGGAHVTLIDESGLGNGGFPGAPARVFDWDGVTPMPSDVTTAADGRYLFAWVAPSTYRLRVDAPAGWRFPSTDGHTPSDPDHVVDPDASFGRAFVIGAAGPVAFDLPCDPTGMRGVFVEISVARPFVEVGDEVEYAIAVANRGSQAASNVILADHLPTGFLYVPGSARRDTTRIPDPVGGRGPTLSFPLGTLAADQVTRIQVRARVGPAVGLGDATSTALASSDDTLSNRASVRVTVIGNAFAEEATVLGSVFLDRDGDRRGQPTEGGVAGVRVWADDGTFAITDPNGHYSFFGLTPRTHALKVDPSTLPDGMKLVAVDHRDGDRPGLRFVDLQRGDLQRADFVLVADSVGRDTTRRPLPPPKPVRNELARTLEGAFSALEEPVPPGDPRARPVSGVVTGESVLPLQGETLPPRRPDPNAPPAFASSDEGTMPAVPGPPEPLEMMAAATDSRVGFLAIQDGDTLGSSQTSVRVKGLQGLKFELLVNGQPVPESRVGRRVTVTNSGIEAWEYVGVRLQPGLNRLAVAQLAPNGTRLEAAEVTVIAPDRLDRIVLLSPRTVPADGHSLALIVVRALDAQGVRAAGRQIVTIESDLGTWRNDDLDPLTPGLQVAVVDGEAELQMVAPTTPGTAVLHARAGDLESVREVEFAPELRPLLLVGTVEGVVSLDHLVRGARAQDRAVTGFEQPIGSFYDASRDGRTSAGARASLFARGRVRNDLALTLGFDSDRPPGLRRFRDLQPDAFYPIYGDGSVKGYEAQSTGRLYARLDRRNASVLYGDFLTGGGGSTRSLTTYARALSGAAGHWEDRRGRVDAFSSRERARRRVDELPGRGISGPYQLTLAPLMENSEQVEILTRDRHQPGVVLQRVGRQRFTDYEIDHLTGRLLFREPVPSIDADLNPITIRVTYETREDGAPAWVNGVDARVQVSQRVQIGGSYVDDHDPVSPYELRGAYLGVRAGASTTIEGEWAVSRLASLGAGDGGRIELRHQSARSNGRLYGAITDSTFSNPAAGFSPGRTELGARWDIRLADRTRLLADGLYSGDVDGTERRGGLLLGIDQGLSRWVRAELGMRLALEQRAIGPEVPEVITVRTKLMGQLPAKPELSGYLEGEQDVRESERHLFAVGGDYRFHSRGRVYARHELLSSLTGPYALDASQRRLSTVMGVDADVIHEAHVFSEYRLADAMSGREAEAAIGLRNHWRIDDQFRVSTTFERVEVLRGAAPGPATAITGSIESTDDEAVRASGRIEVRTSRASDSYLTTLGIAASLRPGWTMLARAVLHMDDQRARGVTLRQRSQLGFAYRPVGSGWDGLARYEFRLDREQTAPLMNDRRIANVVSLHTAGPLADVLHASVGWAGKLVRDEGAGTFSRGGAQWVHGRITEDLGRLWDIGVSSSALFDSPARAVRHGYGIELGRKLGHDLWMSGGWNWTGYEDPDLTSDEFTRAGAYLRMRAKFDESLLFGDRAGAR